jgi:hypothetical protein
VSWSVAWRVCGVAGKYARIGFRGIVLYKPVVSETNVTMRGWFFSLGLILWLRTTQIDSCAFDY